MEQLSFFDFSTNVEDYVENENVTVSKKLSKSINSKGFNILLYGGEKLCFVRMKKIEDFIGLSIREPSDWQGIYIPCDPNEAGKILNAYVNSMIDNGDFTGGLVHLHI